MSNSECVILFGRKIQERRRQRKTTFEMQKKERPKLDLNLLELDVLFKMDPKRTEKYGKKQEPNKKSSKLNQTFRQEKRKEQVQVCFLGKSAEWTANFGEIARSKRQGGPALVQKSVTNSFLCLQKTYSFKNKHGETQSKNCKLINSVNQFDKRKRAQSEKVVSLTETFRNRPGKWSLDNLPV